MTFDNRVRCQDCERYQPPACRAALRGQRRDVASDYKPTVDLPHRCVFFKPSEEGGLTGAQLYPDMVKAYVEQYPRAA